MRLTDDVIFKAIYVGRTGDQDSLDNGKLTTTVAISMKETEHLLNLAKYRILINLVIPEMNIFM